VEPEATSASTVPDDDASLAAEGAGQEARRQPAEPVTTLTGYFKRKRYSPTRFFGDLTEANIWSFSNEDRATAVEVSGQLDPKFTRTISLAAAALRAKDDRFRRPILDFLWECAQQRLRDNPRLAVDGAVAESADTRLNRVSRALAPRLQESKRRTESLNLLIATALAALLRASAHRRDRR
jgi:hypothetical protein